MIMFNLAHLASSLRVPIQIEPRVDGQDRKRADGLFVFQEGPIAIDVSVTHPCARSYVAAASLLLGAAKKRERKKMLEYEKRHQEQGVRFLPFVLETLGGIGPSAESFIKAMADDARLTGSDALIRGNMESFIRKVMATSLQVGNTLLLMEGRRRIRQCERIPH